MRLKIKLNFIVSDPFHPLFLACFGLFSLGRSRGSYNVCCLLLFAFRTYLLFRKFLEALHVGDLAEHLAICQIFFSSGADFPVLLFLNSPFLALVLFLIFSFSFLLMIPQKRMSLWPGMYLCHQSRLHSESFIIFHKHLACFFIQRALWERDY
jgi:hypothetical protein